MNQILKKKTEEFLEARIEEITEMEAGSEMETEAIKNFVAVYSLKNEEDKMELDSDMKHDVNELDRYKIDANNDIERVKIEKDVENSNNQRKHDFKVAGITVAGTILTALVGDFIYVKLTHEGWKNEAQGYYPSSTTFKNFFGKMTNLIKK